MKIDILCNDGSPLGVHLCDIYGERDRIGVGGSEYALLTMCEGWHNRGDEITLYNNPKYFGSSFEQKPISTFQKDEERDILIIFRSPNPRSYGAKGKKIWWSCDQYSTGDFAAFSKGVEKIVVISPFHKKYFMQNYGIPENKLVVTDLPVRIDDYAEEIEKERKAIFTSVPDRGLDVLVNIWPEIEAQTQAELVITGGYKLWGASHTDSRWRLNFMHKPNVKFLGEVRRKELIKQQQSALLYLYPCTYDELFCIALAEAQVAGAYPITTKKGALETTNIGRTFDTVSTEFIQTAVEVLNNPDKYWEEQVRIQEMAKLRFSLDKILQHWDKEIFA